MIKIKFLFRPNLLHFLLLFLSSAFFSNTSYAQNGPLKFWEKASVKSIDGNEVSLDINIALLDDIYKSGTALLFPTLQGAVPLNVKKVSRFGSTLTLSAYEKGRAASAIINRKDGHLSGIIYDDNGDMFVLGYNKDSNSNFLRKVADSEIRGCAVGMDLNSNSISNGMENQGIRIPENQFSDLEQLVVEDTITVDLAIVYTEKARVWAENNDDVFDIEAVISSLDAMNKQVIENSDLALKIRIVHSQEIQNTSNPSDISGNLESMRRNTLSNIDLVALRGQYGADLVMLIDDFEGDFSGVGFVPEEYGGRYDLGYSISSVKSSYLSTTPIHEIGHNLGSRHGRTQLNSKATLAGGIFQFSTGFWIRGETDYVTVMHYNVLENGNSAFKLRQFSNPLLDFDGQPTGIYSDSEASSDNVKSINITKRWIADYEPTVIDGPVISSSKSEINTAVVQAQKKNDFVTLVNNGASNLTWNANLFLNGEYENKDKAEILFSTGFESGEGFQLGTYTFVNGWKTFDEEERFLIFDQNPASGQQSLAIPQRQNQNFYSPMFFSSGMGEYKIKFQFRSDGGLSRFFIDLRNGGKVSAGILLFEDGEIGLYREVNDVYSYWYGTNDGISYEADTWHDVEIEVSPEGNGTIIYRIDGTEHLFTDLGYLTPNQIRIRSTSNSSDWLMIDDISLSVSNKFGVGVSLDKLFGIIKPGESENLNIEFAGNGLANGEYFGDLLINSNDSNTETINIPVSLLVDNSTDSPSGIFTLNIDGENGWRMFSSPVEGATYDDLFNQLWTQGFSGADREDGPPNIYIYDNETAAFSPPDSQLQTIQPGQGFIAYIYADDDDPGPDQTFPKTIEINGDQHGITEVGFNSEPFGFSLIGNPYGSSIDLNLLQSEGIEDVFYTYRSSDDTYISWNGLAGGISDGIVAPFQGFWVQASDAGTSNITFPNEAKISGGIFQKKKEQSLPFIAIRAENNGLSNTAWFSFSEHGSVARDRKDAIKLQPLDIVDYVTIASKSNGNLLDINNLPKDLNEELNIPLNIQSFEASGDGWVQKGGEFKLTWPYLENLPDHWTVILTDTKSDTKIDLKIERNYSFELEPKKLKKHKSDDNLINEQLSTTDETRFMLTIGGVSTELVNGLSIPQDFRLGQNYPNPFNPSTTIEFDLPIQSPVRLAIYNIMGQEIAVLVDEVRGAGSHSVSWDASKIASGLYLYRLRAGNKTIDRKMILLK